ncbi:tubulin-tyrosine ligase family-domain-containing protein [Polychytrium aggregatum]|uniref:tubulin-tyrosine ligase family-domain-containing protein n=1 Tax=Polychytrium aggregatum TaxID=110093 RepID=UPI0022FE3561|nr:tubulin-tyrosine ligase family-domain-containing protein [Polychytrium aggregatum]KAI9204470.1 tubulin-tyrosine ligase family-domain-containing protein [Polychytrium aggregatum]
MDTKDSVGERQDRTDDGDEPRQGPQHCKDRSDKPSLRAQTPYISNSVSALAEGSVAHHHHHHKHISSFSVDAIDCVSFGGQRQSPTNPALSSDDQAGSTPLLAGAQKKRRPKKQISPSLTISTIFCKYDIVRNCALKFGFRIVDDTPEADRWSVCWIDTGVSVERVLSMEPYQKINHFPGMHEICRKDHLARNLNRMSRIFPKKYNFFPKTFILPLEWADFKLAHKARRRKGVWIAKPDHGCQGKGIFLFNSPKEISSVMGSQHVVQGHNNIIVQAYLNRPYLMDGFKFDLRVYALVTSADPLRVFMFKDGLARFATEKYVPPRQDNLADVCMHLTNYAINKHSDKFQRTEDRDKGSKRSARAVLERIAQSRGVPVDLLWKRIGDVVIKTILTVQPQLSRSLRACFPKKTRDSFQASASDMGSQCFEILGFDILLDRQLKAWLLEVNHSPSFTCDSPLDAEIKEGVILGAFKLLNLNAEVERKFHREQKERQKERLLGATVSAVPGEKTRSAGLQGSATAVSAGLTESQAAMSLEELARTKPSVAEEDTETGLVDTPEGTQTRVSSPGSRSSSPSSASGSIRSHSDSSTLSDAAKELLESYYRMYPSHLLDRLSDYEDQNLGDYWRIFPPTDVTKLTQYLQCVAEAANLFAETNSTKVRREYLLKKREKEEEINRKHQEWKARQMQQSLNVSAQEQRRSNLYRSKSLSNITNRKLTGMDGATRVMSLPKPYRELGHFTSKLARDDDARETYSDARSETFLKVFRSLHLNDAMVAEDDDPGPSSYYPPGLRRQPSARSASTIKLNIESINDRFGLSITKPAEYFVSRNPSKIRGPNPPPPDPPGLLRSEPNLLDPRSRLVSEREIFEFRTRNARFAKYRSNGVLLGKKIVAPTSPHQLTKLLCEKRTRPPTFVDICASIAIDTPLHPRPSSHSAKASASRKRPTSSGSEGAGSAASPPAGMPSR